MSDSSSPERSTGGAFRELWWVFLPLLMGILAITRQSFWIDETLTASKAQQPTLAGWWHAIVEEKGSDLQMPLYMIYTWCYEKAVGSSEWVLRAANLPLFTLGMLGFVAAVSSSNLRKSVVALVVSCCPFAWYYLNEVRPYAMQLGASLLIFAALYGLSWGPRPSNSAERFWSAGFLVGIVVLCGSSLLGVIWAGAALAAAAVILSPSRMRELWHSHRVSGPIAVGLTVLLGVYYLWTLKVGARASGAVTTDWKSLIFVGYELLGFSGLGPGRLRIREVGLNAFQPHGIKLALYGVIVLIVLVAAVRRLFEAGDRKKLLKLVLIIVAPVVVLMVAGLVTHFRVLGRHFTPLMPVVLFVLSTGVAALWSRAGCLPKLIVFGFLLLSLFSALSLRFATRHKKDDYRSTVAFCKGALDSGQSVWWNASHEAATHYRLPLTVDPQETGKAFLIRKPEALALTQLPLPDFVVITKPDIYDQELSLKNFLARAGYQPHTNFTAFMIWRRGQ